MDFITIGIINRILLNVQEFATFIGALTVIGGASVWVYQKTIGKRKEEILEKRAQQLRDKIEETNKPLINTLNKLDESLEETIRHRVRIDEVNDKMQKLLEQHDGRLDEHHERLIVLETKGGLRKVGYFRHTEEEDENGNDES